MITYDEEILPNVFTLSAMEHRKPETMATWVLSPWRDDRRALLVWLNYLATWQIEMIGFNNLGFDYPILHLLITNPDIPISELYAKCQAIINSQSFNRFEHQVWQSERIIPQIDLYKIHHFDNLAKSTSLKALEFAMRSRSVQNMPIEPGTVITEAQLPVLIDYNQHDVFETDKFAIISAPNIEFRRELRDMVKGDVLNFNDTKIGKQIIEQRLGEDACYTRVNGKRLIRQTQREFIDLGKIIFPYINFQHAEFNRVLDWLKAQRIYETKGVFSDVEATINGFTFHFGTGGIHGSVSARRVIADDKYAIEDIDVGAFYPSIAIENQLYPEHLGFPFVGIYRGVRDERKNYKKGTPMNGAFKLAANGPYGDSNNDYSPLKDPQFTMTITINGQLLLCMLADRLIDVPTLDIIQINTDGITYRIRRDYIPQARDICRAWSEATLLKLEYNNYSKMFIRDVNNYSAIDLEGHLKQKGAYWYPHVFPDDISNASPSAWYKDMSAMIVQRAAEAAMIDGIRPEIYIPFFRDPFDFMIRAKASKGSQLYIGDQPVQAMTRYYVAKRGGQLRKISPPPPGATPGEFKRKNGISEWTYQEILRSIPRGTWDERIHTKNKSVYDDRETNMQSGWLVADCNVSDHFDWSNVNYDWYIEETRKLIIR